MTPQQIARTMDSARQSFALGRFADAARACEQILAVDAAQPDALFGLGLARVRERRLSAAIDCFNRVLSMAPDEPSVLTELGIALINDGRPEEAIAPLGRAARIDSTNGMIQFHLGNACVACGRPQDAARHFRNALALNGDRAPLLINLATALITAGEADEALEVCRRASAAGVRSAEVHLTVGSALRDLGRYPEAVLEYQRAIALDAKYGAAHCNLGHVQSLLGEVAAAEASYRRACAAPGGADVAREAEFRLSLIRLSRGDLAGGWKGYERRIESEGSALGMEIPAGRARWPGRLDGQGPVVLLTEQGLGDILQSVRYAALLNARGVRPWLQCAPRLARLLATTGYFERIVSPGETLPPTAVWYPLESLPMRFELTIDDLPVAERYLDVDADAVARWRVRLDADERLRVGLVFSGNRAVDAQLAFPRSIAPSAFEAVVAIAGAEFIALQPDAVEVLHGSAIADRVRIPPDPLDNPQDGLSDTAAIIRGLDLVISADTALLHLAGALGTPAWAALPRASNWRWFEGRSDSPFYPSMRLYRSCDSGWETIFGAMARDLAALIAKRTATQAT